MPSIARITDLCVGTCLCHVPPIPMSGTIITGSDNVKTNNLGTARQNDLVLGFCGHIGIITSSSGNVNTNNIGTARTGDIVVGCLTGIIVTGSGDTNANI